MGASGNAGAAPSQPMGLAFEAMKVPSNAPVEVLKREAATGKTGYRPPEPTNPQEAVAVGNWYAEYAQVASRLERPVQDVFMSHVLSQPYEEKRQQYERDALTFETKGKNLESDYNSFNARVESFNAKYSGRQLSQSEYNAAVAEQAALATEGEKLKTRASSYKADYVKLGLEGQKLGETAKQVEKRIEAYNAVQEKSAQMDAFVRSATSRPTISTGTYDVKQMKEPLPETAAIEFKGYGSLPANPLTSVLGQIYGGAQESVEGSMELGRAGRKESNAMFGGNEFLGAVALPIGIGVAAGKGISAGVSAFAANPSRAIVEGATGFERAVHEEPFKLGTGMAISYFSFKGAGTILGAARKGITQALAFRGKQLVPAREIVAPEVLSYYEGKGGTKFPYSKGTANELLDKYFSGEYATYSKPFGENVVYSATDYPFTPYLERSFIVKSGQGLAKASDVPALYTSVKGVSIRFLRLTTKEAAAEYNLFPTSSYFKELLIGRSPKILAIAENPQAIPSSFTTSLQRAQAFFGKTPTAVKTGELSTIYAEKGVPYITPAYTFGIKPEAEAAIRVGSNISRTGLTSVWSRLTGFSKYTILPKEVKLPFIKPFYVSEKVPIYTATANTFKNMEELAVPTFRPPQISVEDLSSASKPVKPIVSSSAVASVVSTASTYVYPKAPSASTPSQASSSKIVSASLSSVSSPSLKSFSSSTISSLSRISRTSAPSAPYSSRASTPETRSVPSTPSTPSTSRIKVPSFKLSLPKPSTSIISIPTYKPPTTPPPKKKTSEESSNKIISEGFIPFARVKGTFQKLSRTPLPKNLALKTAARYAETTTARSITIKPAGATPIKDIPRVDLSRFRMKKAKSKILEEPVYIEKSRFAINTLGEKMGLKKARLRAPKKPVKTKGMWII